jgi:hypothetical protein
VPIGLAVDSLRFQRAVINLFGEADFFEEVVL